ncbi:GNAT family N-acetyltransferase [Desulfocurvus sp. DL9XJH121]
MIDAPDLFLVPFTEEHLTPEYVSWLNDPQTTAYSEQRHRRHTLESCRAYLHGVQPPDLFLAVCAKPDGVHIGNVGVAVDPANGLANVSIVLGVSRGRGLGRVAWTAVCDHLFRALGMRKVQAGTMRCNWAMAALARGVGMREDGVRRRHYLLDGQEVDIVHFALFREDWLAWYPESCWQERKTGGQS